MCSMDVVVIFLMFNIIAIVVTCDKLSDKLENIAPTVRNGLEQTIKDNAKTLFEAIKYMHKDIIKIDDKSHEIDDKLHDIDKTLAVQDTTQEYQYSNLKENQKEIYTKLVEIEKLVKDCKYDISENS